MFFVGSTISQCISACKTGISIERLCSSYSMSTPQGKF